MKLSRIFQQSSLYLIGDILRRAISFILLPFYTRVLTTSDYGTIELLDLMVMVANVSLGTLAIGDAMIRIYHDRRGDQNSVVSTALWCIMIVSSALLAGGLLCAGPLSLLLFHKTGYESLIRLGVTAIFFGNLLETALVYQRLRQRPAFFIGFSLAILGSNSALNVYLIAWLHMGVRGFFVSKLVCMSIGACILLAFIVREVRSKFDLEVAGRIAQFGAPLIFSGIAVFVVHFSDRFFLSRYATLAEIGVYALAYKFGFLVSNLVGVPFESAWNVQIYGHAGEPGWQESFGRVVRYLLFFLVLAGLGLTIMSDEALAIVAPPAYRTAALLIPMIVAGYIVREVGDFFRGVMFVNKRVHLFSGITVACAVLNLGLNQLLIPGSHAVGAAWATFFTWLAYMTACWIVVHREHELPYPVTAFGLILAIAGIAYCASLPISRLPSMWQWAPDAAILLGFISAVWFSGYFPESDRRASLEYIRVRIFGRPAVSVAEAGE